MIEKRFKNFRRVMPLIVGSALVLTACGGGSSGDSRQRNVALPVANKVISIPISQVAAGGHHNLVLDQSGRIHAWGLEFSGSLNVPALQEGASKFTTVSSGGFHSLALDDTGRMYGWGNDGNRQTRTPTLATGATAFTSIAVGTYHSLALDDTGRMYGWGFDVDGQATP
ncbi:MAG: RCC1 domain-containing protein, partial [Ilumatobacteraceae bacterium]